jgi:hypothetical protein
MERTKFHMTELDEAFRSYLERAFEFEHHPERPQSPWKMEVKEHPLFETFPVIVGEAVQSMRSALDYLVYELAGHAGASGRAQRRTQFPISTNGLRYFERGRHQVRPLRGEHRRRIRKLQPYQAKANAVSQPLAILNRLSNTDKHRLLLTVINQMGAISFNLSVSKAGEPMIHGTKAIALPAYLKDTEEIEEMQRRDPDLGGIAWVELRLEDEEAAVVATLKRLLWTVTEIVDGFEPVFGKK